MPQAGTNTLGVALGHYIHFPAGEIKEMSSEQWGHSAQQDIPSWPMTHLEDYGALLGSDFPVSPAQADPFHVVLSPLCKEQVPPHSYRKF